jgi:hypothetical protein
MLISKLIRRVKKKVAKYEAVGMIIVFIILAVIAGYFLAQEIAKEKIFEAVLTIAIGGFFSWDMINFVVGTAIDTESQLQAEKRIEDYKSTSTQQKIIEKQNLEFLATIPTSNRKGEDSYSLPGRHDTWEDVRQKIVIREATVRGLDILTREAILRGLNNEDDPLRGMALAGAGHALKRSYQEIQQDSDLKIFFQDIYVYLKAWLMLSIKHDREMDFKKIRQRYPKSDSPNVRAYIKALQYIRRYSIDSTVMERYITNEYIANSRQILKQYLKTLIEQLEKSAKERP